MFNQIIFGRKTNFEGQSHYWQVLHWITCLPVLPIGKCVAYWPGNY